ncbi:hypothetical protein A2957_00140 [Candidatus Roizmanbacteria bacterium RIFCSPLOWO2_01_FULL_38_11]|uniref:Uncharacterized protein n=1 Tax=Candidatus Roizmanbacteria bacterium RIFCSPLOWO2_01_FULL_38_11 TaxID=1802060 RepID=A0A1F7IM38_9BACT|nr:MAG: hypothetical protein A2957_00140 [Candidatus Roizmanbacteria bacterium RIFCSPLOWO2_01_FULL_38_11]
MKAIIKYFGVFIILGVIFNSQLSTLNVVSAQESLPLQVAPARQEIELDPGEKTSVVIRFFNLGETPLSGILKAGDFIVNDDKGTPTILETADQASPRFSASKWFTLPYDRMTIAPNDKVGIQAEITVPENARPGGRYVAVYFEPNASIPGSINSPREAGLGVASRIAGLVYIKIRGPITEKALVSGIFAPSFQEYGPIRVQADILNRGDYHIRPRGTFSLRNMLNGLTDQKKIAEQNIFPDASRNYEVLLGKKWMIGKYKVSVSASYGNGGDIIMRSVSVWVFPWKIATAVFLALLILILMMKQVYKNFLYKESHLEEELKKEHEQVEELRQQMEKRD